VNKGGKIKRFSERNELRAGNPKYTESFKTSEKLKMFCLFAIKKNECIDSFLTL